MRPATSLTRASSSRLCNGKRRPADRSASPADSPGFFAPNREGPLYHRRHMHSFWLALCLAVACTSRRPPPGPGAEAPSIARATTLDGARATTAPVESGYYDESELRALGVRVTPAEKQQLLLCGGASDSNCVCLAPLPCQAAGNCVGFEANIKGFRSALTSKQAGRSVDCKRGELGRCGAFRYFDFE